ncbi:MAG TPA: tail fiber domain-containing protein, partial [Kiritimatiellia bacterium]|nr:tail fiber domain-containing protein [Kiritimatiellia bacterium]
MSTDTKTWTRGIFIILAALTVHPYGPLLAQPPALINYQGRLVDGTNLVNGNVEMSLRLFDAATGGTMLYEDSNTVTVVDGLYATHLGDDTTEGSLAAALAASEVWLEIAVDDVALTPRERIASVAYALVAEQAATVTGPVSDSQLSANIARLDAENQTFTGQVVFHSASNQFSGVFSGDGTNLKNIPLSSMVENRRVLVAWGDNGQGQTNVPAHATGVVAIAAGDAFSAALRDDGTVVAWGTALHGVTDVPAQATGVVAIAAGFVHCLALRGDGHVMAWGWNSSGQTNVPEQATNVVAIAAGLFHSLALRSDGKVVAWGSPLYNVTNVPAAATGVVAIAAGYFHSLALRSDGVVLAWGSFDYGNLHVPAQAHGAVAIAAGGDHCLALRPDGTVVAWGRNDIGQANVPANAVGVVAISCNGRNSMALRSDGKLLIWGDTTNGLGNIPEHATNVTAIAAGGTHRMALINESVSVPLARLDTDATFSGTVTAFGFAGNGAGLTNLSATALASGLLPDARLSTNVALLNTGTYPDARLSTNIARLNATQTFSARQNHVTAPGVRAIEVIGDRTGNFNNSVVYIENTNRASASPALRLVGWGTNANDDAVLNVSAQGAGRIARFGNSNNWVVVIDNAGNVDGLTFTPSSDRNAKENFVPVAPAEILEKVIALPISRWNYQADAATPHIGPMAQDFHAAFGVGPDDTRIATVDADGVALAAIQGLNEKVDQRMRDLEA